MSDYEYADLFVSFIDAQNGILANYMAIVFGMVTVSWFLAARMTWSMIAVLLFMYTYMTINLIFASNAVVADFARLGTAIQEAGNAPDTSLGWLGPVAESGRVRFIDSMPLNSTIYCIVTYIVTIIFFFIMRFQNKREVK